MAPLTTLQEELRRLEEEAQLTRNAPAVSYDQLQKLRQIEDRIRDLRVMLDGLRR